MTYHTVAMPTSDHILVLMTTSLTSTDCESFIKAMHPAKKWNVRQERGAFQETQHILAGQDTPMDAVSRADAVLKVVAQTIIRQGKRTKRTRLKTNTHQWHTHFQVALHMSCVMWPTSACIPCATLPCAKMGPSFT